LQAFLGELSSNRSGVVEIDEFAVFLLYIFLSFRNKVDIIIHYDNIPFWISTPMRMTSNAHLNSKCDFRTARLLWLSKPIMRD